MAAMNGLRFRISTLMAIVLMAGAVFATGSLSGDLEIPLFVGGGLVVLGTLGAATLGLIYRHGERRAFWVGFSLFGWLLTLICLVIALAETEILFLTPMALPFGWIGGVIARAFAASSNGRVALPPPGGDPSTAVSTEDHHECS
jgi:hypothetical protein